MLLKIHLNVKSARKHLTFKIVFFHFQVLICLKIYFPLLGISKWETIKIWFPTVGICSILLSHFEGF